MMEKEILDAVCDIGVLETCLDTISKCQKENTMLTEIILDARLSREAATRRKLFDRISYLEDKLKEHGISYDNIDENIITEDAENTESALTLMETIAQAKKNCQ